MKPALPFTITFDLQNIDHAATQVAQILQEASSPFMVGYQAEMGVGKTTFSRALLYALGLDRREPVLSPTFTYVSEYQIAGKLYAHLDLYRLDGPVQLEELLGRSLDEFRGILIEWPENGGGTWALGCQFLLQGEVLNEVTRRFTLSEIEHNAL